MKIGDLVKMQIEPFPNNPYGFGVLMSFNPHAKGYNCSVLFFKLINAHFDGLKWCFDRDLEVISEDR